MRFLNNLSFLKMKTSSKLSTKKKLNTTINILLIILIATGSTSLIASIKTTWGNYQDANNESVIQSSGPLSGDDFQTQDTLIAIQNLLHMSILIGYLLIKRKVTLIILLAFLIPSLIFSVLVFLFILNRDHSLYLEILMNAAIYFSLLVLIFKSLRLPETNGKSKLILRDYVLVLSISCFLSFAYYYINYLLP